jgi:hypothetical protein
MKRFRSLPMLCASRNLDYPTMEAAIDAVKALHHTSVDEVSERVRETLRPILGDVPEVAVLELGNAGLMVGFVEDLP